MSPAPSARPARRRWAARNAGGSQHLPPTPSNAGSAAAGSAAAAPWSRSAAARGCRTIDKHADQGADGCAPAVPFPPNSRSTRDSTRCIGMRRRRGDRVQWRAGLRRLRNGGPPPRAAPVFFAPFHGRAARSHEHLDHNGRGVTRAHHHTCAAIIMGSFAEPGCLAGPHANARARDGSRLRARQSVPVGVDG